MELTMFERLQQLPLLQGMGTKDIENMIFKVQLDFKQHQAGDLIVSQEESCRKLIFIISGSLSVQYCDVNNSIIVTEEISAPAAIEPFSMYGMKQRFTRDYTFETDGSTLTIPKAVFMSTLMEHPIIRTNMLNMVCNKMQQATNMLMQPEPQDIYNKVQNLFRNYCLSDRGTKFIKIKMDTIADMIGETRLSVSKALRKLSNEKLITQHRSEITIPDMHALLTRK